MINRIATGTLALAAGVAIGWFAAPAGNTFSRSTNADAGQILRQLVEAGDIIDVEQRAITVRSIFADTKSSEMIMLVEPVMELSARRPDMALREGFLRRWGELSPQEALTYLGPGAPSRDRDIVLTAWGRTDPDGAAAGFRPPDGELPDESRSQARAILAGIAEADAVKALLFADRFNLADLTRLEAKPGSLNAHPSFEPTTSYQKAVDIWIRRAPADAFEVMHALKSARVREQALNELFFGWSNENPEVSQEAADRFWESLQSESDSRVPLQNIELLKTLARNRGERNGVRAYEQIIGLADPTQRLAALKAAFEGWMGLRNERLAEVADFVATRLHSSDQTSTESELMIHAAEWTAGWLTENGENENGIGQAATWLEKLPPGAAHDAAIRGIASSWWWLSEKRRKLDEWIDGLPVSRQKDVAIATIVKRISDKEPARAMDMAATIVDPSLRGKALAHVGARFIPKEEGGTMAFDLRKWMRENPETGAELRAAAGGN